MGCGGGCSWSCRRVEISEPRAGGFGGHFRGRGFAVAVDPEAASVSSAGGCRHRSSRVQVFLADYDDGDRERGAIVGGLVDEAVRGPFGAR